MQQNIFEVAKCKLRSESLNVSCTHNFTAALRDSSNKSSFHWFAVHTDSQLTCFPKLPLPHDSIWYNVCFTSSLNNNTVTLHCGKYLIYIFCHHPQHTLNFSWIITTQYKYYLLLLLLNYIYYYIYYLIPFTILPNTNKKQRQGTTDNLILACYGEK